MYLHQSVRVRSGLLAFAVAALAVDAAAQETPARVSVSDNETPALWFVEFTSQPAVEGTSRATLRAEREAFESAARDAGVRYRRRFVFESLWNGVSVSARGSDLAKLGHLPGVANIYPVISFARPEPQNTNLPELFTALAMTGADTAQTSGYTGAGVKIGIIDTGVDYDHPDLGGGGFPNAKVIAGYDFVGDAYNADPDSASYNPVPAPDADPDDCEGHGTHVAGIAAASGTFLTGVAPDALLGAYRVFGCEGSTDADVMIAAMERAYADGMDIVNMSIGSSFQWPEYPTAVAADRLVRKGVVVVCSIGNVGTSGLYAASAPGVGKNVIGVASVDNTHVVLPYFEVNGAAIGYVPMTFAGPTPTDGGGEIVYLGLGCDPTTFLADPAGKIALIARGTCGFGVKAANAINAGATAVIIHNNAPGVFNGTLGAPIDGTTPVVGISLADGLFLRAQPAPVLMEWTPFGDSFVSPTGGLISSFSSYGLAPDLSLKPDIAAPGGNIFSTVPLEQGGFATLSGTSMASPHVAGTAALLLQAKPWLHATAVRDILQNNATPTNWWGNPGLGFLDQVHRQGAGLVQIDTAIAAKTLVTPGKLALGESDDGPIKRLLTIQNNSHKPETYTLTHTDALATGPNTFTVAADFVPADVMFSAASITVPPHRWRVVVVTVTAPADLDDRSLYGGYIELTAASTGAVTRVPFAGFKGDYQAIQVLTPTANGFPWLATLDGDSFLNEPAGATYTMEGEDIPYLLMHLDHQSRLLRVTIHEAATGAPIHRIFHTAFKEDFLPRNTTAAGFFAFPWDGTRLFNRGWGNDQVKPVPDGTYLLKVSLLKALGNPFRSADWETWTSPPITIDRP